MKTLQTFLILLICGSLLAGCYPLAPQAQSPEVIYTSAAETIAATLTIGANLANLQTQIPQVTSTPEPSFTPMPAEATPTIGLPATEMILPSATFTTAAPGTPMISSTVNTNCRAGPSSTWEIVSGLMVGDTSRVIGRLYTNNWYLIVDPDDASNSCWVWSKTTVIAGDLNQIPIVPMPSTPTPDLPVFTISAVVSPSQLHWSLPGRYHSEWSDKIRPGNRYRGEIHFLIWI